MNNRSTQHTLADFRAGRIRWRVAILWSVPAVAVGILNGASL
jgi:hypothetical protein